LHTHIGIVVVQGAAWWGRPIGLPLEFLHFPRGLRHDP
jgi:hypothetical protein